MKESESVDGSYSTKAAGKVERFAFVGSCFVEFEPTCTSAAEIIGTGLSISHSRVNRSGFSVSGLHVL